MIDKPEIDAMAAQLDVHTSNVQRDYAFGWLLSGLFQPSNPLSQQLILKGGNCFRKAYFENARYSNDIDFGVVQEVDPNILMQAVRDASNYARGRSGIEFFVDESTVRPKRVDGTFSAFEAKLYFQSFYGEHENLKMKVSVDVKEFDSIFLPVQNRALVHAYSDANSCASNIRCLKLEELLAQKLKALLMRQHSPDLFDFVHAVFFQKVLAVSRMEVLKTFFKHTAYGDDPASAKGLLLQLPFDVLRGFWDKYFDCPKVSFFTFDNAAGWFKETIADLFALNEPRFASPGLGFRGSLILPLLSGLHRLPIMRISCLAAGPLSSVARTSSG
jgi:predicted nucleotidyltransferase component of viral defense system